MIFEKHISTFAALGLILQKNAQTEERENLLTRVKVQNPWFIPVFTQNALAYWVRILNQESLHEWLGPYKFTGKSKKVGLILAGNIPMVGFHDVLSALVMGHQVYIKLSEKDSILIPYVLDLLCEIEPFYKSNIHYINGSMPEIDAVIATGSNVSARTFEYYFQRIPRLIRGHRASLAVLTGQESPEDLALLMDDLFLYFGLGCRNISHLHLPEGYSFDAFYQACSKYEFLLQHAKYFNNYQYYKTIELINQAPILDMGIATLKPSLILSSPLSVLHISYYQGQPDLSLFSPKEIQCVVGQSWIPFGQSQKPALSDYADHVNTLDFLHTI